MITQDSAAPAKTKADSEAKPKAGADSPAKAEAKEKAKKSSYYVVGPGAVMHDGKRHAAGARLTLTDEDALSLGDAVAEGEPPPPPEEIDKRTAGKYRVAGPGKVWFDGKARDKGFVLDLSEEEARKLGTAVERAA